MINLLLVMAGGAIGSALRYGVSVALPTASTSFPAATILVNIIGSFILGFIIGTVGTPLELHPQMRLLLGSGLCGGFTTYSAFAVESAMLLEHREPLVMGTYVVSTIVGCGLAALAGIALSRSIAHSQ
ncbi:MAG: fluoride efflux transporter FluC [Ignavibacteria bacterium]|jgi:CrcB protein